ncbi:MAG: hypothetical protein A2X77_00030 [Gammaproteobacteria bacterium GWE2_42_36]|nr:MAG: hypothetical protein A2X77_00030 [Gammaproteobacteria bacterium GWE2_42_36]HCU04969.1 hypothetical protein [Coxiellaceae bacterium]
MMIIAQQNKFKTKIFEKKDFLNILLRKAEYYLTNKEQIKRKSRRLAEVMENSTLFYVLASGKAKGALELK